MAVVECPKCGRAADEGAIICPGCDYILDASFLGDDITDDERDRRPRKADGPGRTKAPGKASRVDFGEDAMILGNLDDAEVSSFRSRDAGVSQREVTQTRFYIGGAVAQLMEPDAIPELAAGVSGASIRMTPFERHVLGFVNGKRSVGRIHKKSAMEESEFKTAIAMLADKGFIRLKGWKKPRPAGASATDTMTGSSRTGAALTRPRSQVSQAVSQAVTRPPEGERTVVASMDHIEAMARQAAEQRQAKQAADASSSGAPSSSGGRRPGTARVAPAASPDSFLDTPVAPMAGVPPTDGDGVGGGADDDGFDDAGVVTRVAGAPTLSAPVSPVPSRRFASLQAAVPDSAGESSAHARRPLAPGPLSETADIVADGQASTAFADGARGDEADEPVEPVDPLAAAAAAAWDGEDNQSSVFADSSAHPRAHPPAAADDDEADGFEVGHTAALEAFRDPTGLGDSLAPDDDDNGGDGAPVDQADDEADDDGDAPFVSAESLSAEARARHASGDGDAAADDAVDDAHDGDGNADGNGADDDGADDDGADDDGADDDGADDDVAPTDADVRDDPAAFTSAQRIHEEVTGALPAPAAPAHDDADDFVTAPPTSHIPRPMTLPSEALSPVVAEAPRPAVPAPPVAAPFAAVVAPPSAPVLDTTAPVALPGQAILKSGDAGFSQPMPVPKSATPSLAPTKPPAPTRVSASSQVPFELRKKAERIYEQAIKDQAEGRISSAMMNARLAMNFDPTVDAYRELHEELARQKVAPKVGGARPQELILFEQASDAEGRGDYLKAVKLLEQAIELSPRAAALYNRLGVVLSIRLKRHEEALAHLKKAIELEPGSVVYMNNFSKVTGLLESVIEKAPRKRGPAEQGGQVAVKKIRPKMF